MLPKITASLLVLCCTFTLTVSQAQDLDIPGLEDVTSPAPAAAETPGTATRGKASLWDMVVAGGPMMIVLGAMSAAVIGMFFFGMIDIQKKNFAPDHLVNALRQDMENADLESAVAKLQPGANCLSSVMSAAFNHLGERGFHAVETEKQDLADLMGAASRKFNRGRARMINYFSVIAQAGPMLGLLGTVAGMILAFQTLSSSGGGDPSAFAGDISMALVTTAGGLLVALPAIFCYFIMRDRLQSMVALTDESADELMAHLRRALAAYHQEQAQ